MSKFGKLATRTFLEALKNYDSSKTMQALNLSTHIIGGDNKITAFECYKLAKKISEPNNNIVSLNLNNFWFEPGGIKILSDALTNENCQIKSLYLNSNNLKDYGLEDLINAIPKSTLKFLSINNNIIGNSGAHLIAKAIVNEGLRLNELSLNSNGIDEKGAMILKEAILKISEAERPKISFINNPMPHDKTFSFEQFNAKYPKIKPEELSDTPEFMYDQKHDEEVQLVDGLTPSQQEILDFAVMRGLYVSSEKDNSASKKYSTDYSTVTHASIFNFHTQKELQKYYNEAAPQVITNAELQQSRTTEVYPMGQEAQQEYYDALEEQFWGE